MSSSVETATQSEWRDLPGGLGKYRRDAEDPRFGRVMCPDCGKEKHRILWSEGSKQFLEITGRCGVCAAQNRSPLKGTLHHPSGASFLFDKKEGIESPNVEVWIRCANPASNPGCPGEY